MNAALSFQMREMDRCAIEDFSIPGVVLMERASYEVFVVCNRYLEKTNGNKCAVVCGTGNNGGDGFAVARMLYCKGYDVNIVLPGESSKIKGDALINYEICKKLEINIVTNFNDVENTISNSDIVIDAIFGTGFSAVPREPYSDVIRIINEYGKYVVSVDVPSGIDCDSIKEAEICVKADETVTFVMKKKSMLFYPAKEYCGKITIGDIGMPKEAIEKQNLNINILDEEYAKKLLPKRKPYGNKGTFGKVFVVAGSKKMMGAALFSAEAAYRIGCGLVYCCIPEQCVSVMQSLLPEAVEKPLKTMDGMFYVDSFGDIVYSLNEAKVILIGPGMGRSEDVTEFVFKVIENGKAPFVIDADAINAISLNVRILNRINKMSVITPHLGEMSRLTGLEIGYIKENIIEVALDFAVKYNIVVVLKDSVTVIASPDGQIYVNETGNDSMAKGGSGDVLAGIIAGLIAQGMDSFMAAVLGTYIHGLCGMASGEILSNYCPLARDIIGMIPNVIKQLL